MSSWARNMMALLLAASISGTFAGCSNVDKPESDAVIETRNPVDFFPEESIETAQTNMRSTAANFVYNLVMGDYATALKFLDSETCLFNENALQKMALSFGIGRGDKLTFYNITSGRPVENEDTGETEYVEAGKCVTVEYDLEYLGKTDTVTKTIYITKDANGLCYVDPVAHKWVVSGGELRFQVPGKVEVYLNGVFIPQSYMGNDNIYTVNTVLPRLSTEKADEGKIELTLKSKFGLEATYQLYYLGSKKENKKGVSDECFSSSKEINSFVIPIPRETRESAQEYLQTTVFPTLLTDITKGTEWQDSGTLALCGEGSSVEAMSALYYPIVRRFLQAQSDEGGKYFFQEVTVYDVQVKSDEGIKLVKLQNKVTDYNKLQLEVTFKYQFKFNKGSAAKEDLVENKKTTVVTLSKDDEGNWYLSNIDESGMKYSVP